MKKFAWIFILIAAAAAVIFYMTRQQRPQKMNADFTRNYLPAVNVGSFFEAPCNIDVLAAWNGTLIGYSIGARCLVQMDTAGKLLRRIAYDPPGQRGIFHSMSGDTNYLYAFDMNNRTIWRTNFRDSLVLFDSLPKGIMGAVKNQNAGYICQQFNGKSKDAVLRELDAGANVSDTVYAFTSFKDWGVSHRGQLFRDAGNSSFYFLSFYNADVLRYDYARQRLHHISTIDNNPVKDMSIATPKGRILSSKARVVNRIAAANKDHLFVLSYARSKEDPHANQPIIDVYAASTGNYCYSFPVPGIKGMRISSLTCIDDRLVISFNHVIKLLSFNEHATCK